MAGLLDEEELLPVFSNPNIARQGARARALAAQRNVNTLPDPRTYAAVQGLLGTRPDEMGFSVLNPAYEDIRRVADTAFAVGTALEIAPLMGMARFSRPVQQASAASQRGAVRATKGSPVGASIQDVSNLAIARGTNQVQGAAVLIGDRIFLGRTHGDALNRAVYEGVVRKEGGKYIYPKGAEVDMDLFMLNDGRIVDRLTAYRELDVGAAETAIEKGLMQNTPGRSMTVDEYMKQAKALKQKREKTPSYPQEEALRLAQQRAALPVEQGGLGLPKDNTPMDRARAMGFDTETSYIHSTTNPFTKINEDAKFSGIFTLPNYSANYGTSNMPLVAKGEIATSDDLRRLVKRPTKKMQMAIDEIIPENVDISDATVEMQKLRNELARKYGFSGVKVSDEFGQDTVALVKPQNIRSRFAAFDPFRLTPAIAATMGVAAPDLLARTIDDEERRRQLLSGLLAP